jgi:signal transduction histidine kinase
LAPLLARSEILGWMALGPKLGGTGYSGTDLQILQAALGIASVALQNARLHGQMMEVNRQLLASNAHLQEVDGLKSEFLRNVNHELRTPLAVVMATLECVIQAGSNEHRIQSILEGAFECARHLNELLENLLTYSSAVHERMTIELADENLADLLKDYCDQRRPGVTASLRELDFSCEPELPAVRCDRQRLLQILDQLVDNALKFTPSDSRLRLWVGAQRESGEHWVRVEFSDDGPGIPRDRIHAVFNSFEQADGSPTRAVGGLGMGLALARELAERMGCRLDVRSDHGRGATFTLLIPAPASVPSATID